MRDVERRKLEKFEREQAFMTENAADFPKDSPGDKAAKTHSDIIEELRELAARQISGGSAAAQSFSGKEDALDDLQQMIRNLNRAANAFADEVPGSEMQFRLPRNRSQQNLLATARSFLKDAQPLKTKFVEYGLADDFLAQRQTAITAFDTAGANADTGAGEQSAAVEGLRDAARRGMTNANKLNAVVRIKYQHNPQKLAAWTVASHLEREPKRTADLPKV